LVASNQVLLNNSKTVKVTKNLKES